MICPTCGHDNVPGVDLCDNCQLSLTALDQPVAGCRVERSLMQDHVSLLPTKPAVALLPETPVSEAVALMLSRNVGAVLVVDAEGKLVGIFGERDLLKRVVGRDDYASRPIREFMTPRPVAVAENATLAYVLHQMDGGGYRHVPVVVDSGKPVAVVSVRDMLRHILRLCKDA